jgi:predicted RNA-binding protein YlxR (DUF448 family)
LIAAVTATTGSKDLRERRCIVTGEALDEAELIRFAVDPDGHVVPDVAATLPGRGLWVKADRESLNAAIARNAFTRAAKTKAVAGSDLVARVERLLVERMMSDLGLARRAGQIVFGFDNVARALQAKTAPAVLVEASDGAADGKRKLFALVQARNLAPKRVECLNSGEISVALGRENVIHAALQSGRLSERLVMDAGRLSSLRAAATNAAGPNPAAHERDE